MVSVIANSMTLLLSVVLSLHQPLEMVVVDVLRVLVLDDNSVGVLVDALLLLRRRLHELVVLGEQVQGVHSGLVQYRRERTCGVTTTALAARVALGLFRSVQNSFRTLGISGSGSGSDSAAMAAYRPVGEQRPGGR